MTVIFTVITCLCSFYKADFINLTVCTVAIYLLVNADQAKQSYFRILVFATIASLLLDIVWFRLRDTAHPKDNEKNGDEATIVKFSIIMAYISMAFKIVMCVVYWRTSIDFASVID
jgi:hypothetical protein